MNNIATRLMDSFREELKDEYQAKIDEANAKVDETKRVYEGKIGEYENKLGETKRVLGEYKTKLRDADRLSQERFAIKLIKNGSDLSFVSLNTDLDMD